MFRKYKDKGNATNINIFGGTICRTEVHRSVFEIIKLTKDLDKNNEE